MMRVAEATPQEAYARELDRLLRQVGRLEEQAVRQALTMLADARRRIIERLAQVPPDAYLASFLPRLQGEVERIMAQYATDYQAWFQGHMADVQALGLQSVDAPLLAAGVRAEVFTQLPRLSTVLTDVLQGFQAGLITQISDLAIQRITSELQLGVLGGLDPFDIQRRIGEILRTQLNPQGVFGTVATRAEMILRTEVNRVFALSVEARQQALVQGVAETFPEAALQKEWLNAGDARVRPAHRPLRGGVGIVAMQVPMTGDFELIDDKGQRWRAKHPLDPRLPAALSVACRCRSIISTQSVEALLAA